MSSKLLNFPAATTTRFVSNSTASSSTRIPPSVAWNYDNLRLAEVLCPVCQSVLVEPVFLPCKHLFCRDCLSGTIEKNSLCCPCCRKRFGTWYRHASRGNTLVHERLWEAIQSQFRDLLEDDSSPRATKASTTTHATTTFPKLNSPGSLRKEYNEELKRYQQELLEEKQKEVIASEQYIINLYKQEGVIDLADSSSHVSVSSATTPDLQENGTKVYGGNTSSLAGPSSSSSHQLAPKAATYGTGTMAAADSRSDKIVATQGSSRASPSNGSVISISSTSSAVSAVTSTSCVSSSISERFSIIKSVTQTLGRSAELVKQKATDLTQRLSFGKQKTTTTNIDLNKSELCMKPTELHKTEQRGAVDEDDDGEADETDSLKAEQNHFVPIHASLPKSSFSLDTVVRVPPKRTPQACAAKYTLSPRKCSIRPLLSPSTAGGRSAFSVVNFCLLTPPKNPLSPDGATAAEQEEPSSHSSPVSASQEKKANGTTVQARGGGRRRRKLKFTPTKARKSSSTVARSGGNAGSSEAVQGTTTRTTRRTSDSKTTTTLLKDIIVSDQQRLEQQIEMERRDFEFAQKLQQKLNRPHGVMQEIHRPYPPVARNCSYSLRRKGSDNVSESSGVSTKRQTEADVPEDAKSVAQRTRKRKATSSSVENDVPTVSPPSEGTARKRQTRRTIKAEPVESTSTGASVEAAVAPVQRKSTRNKAR
uniref:RING-type E3 ubiquitin transferase n=1 Tax=Anopheles marajoara TaxID=58244 RepID=A0A2M4BFN1_9DIPT